MDIADLKPVNEMTLDELADYGAARRDLTNKAEAAKIMSEEAMRQIVAAKIVEQAKAWIPAALHDLVSWGGTGGRWNASGFHEYFGWLMVQVEGWAQINVYIEIGYSGASYWGYQDLLDAYGAELVITPYMGRNHDEAWIVVREPFGFTDDDGWYIETAATPAQDFAEALDLARRAAPRLAEMRAECDRRNTKPLDESGNEPKLVVPALSDVLAHYQGVRLTDQVAPLLGVIVEALITLTDALQNGEK
jgi:hypothetical protein